MVSFSMCVQLKLNIVTGLIALVGRLIAIEPGRPQQRKEIIQKVILAHILDQ